MAERLSSRGAPEVVVNSLTPGFCRSDLTANAHGIAAVGFWILSKATARTTEAGSRCLVAAVSKGAESHGQYINDGEVDELVHTSPHLHITDQLIACLLPLQVCPIAVCKKSGGTGSTREDLAGVTGYLETEVF